MAINLPKILPFPPGPVFALAVLWAEHVAVEQFWEGVWGGYLAVQQNSIGKAKNNSLDLKEHNLKYKMFPYYFLQ